MTFNENDVNREQDGKFGAKTGWPPDPSVTLGASVAFEDKYDLLSSSNGDRIQYDSYEDALAAAGGDEKRVWTITEDGYPDPAPGEQFIYKFDLDGDEETFEAGSEAEARDLAASGYDARYGVGEGDEEDSEPTDGDNLDLEGVYRGDTIDYEDEWEPVSTLNISAGGHLVNRLEYVVSTAPWADEAENYAW